MERPARRVQPGRRVGPVHRPVILPTASVFVPSGFCGPHVLRWRTLPRTSCCLRSCQQSANADSHLAEQRTGLAGWARRHGPVCLFRAFRATAITMILLLEKDGRTVFQASCLCWCTSGLRAKTILQFPRVKRLERALIRAPVFAAARNADSASPASGFRTAKAYSVHQDAGGANWLSVANLRTVTFGASLCKAAHLRIDHDMYHLIQDVTGESSYGWRVTQVARANEGLICTCRNQR